MEYEHHLALQQRTQLAKQQGWQVSANLQIVEKGVKVKPQNMQEYFQSPALSPRHKEQLKVAGR